MLDDTELKANISKRLTISQLIEKYEAQRASMDDVIANFEAAARAVSAACSIHGKVWGSPWRDRSASPCKKTMEANLLRAAWEAVIDGLNIKEVATAKDIAKMNLALENPPEFTRDNISATFGDYLLDPRQNLLRPLLFQAKKRIGYTWSIRCHSYKKQAEKSYLWEKEANT